MNIVDITMSTLFSVQSIYCYFRRIKLPELQALLYQQDGETVFGVEYDVALHPGKVLGGDKVVKILDRRNFR